MTEFTCILCGNSSFRVIHKRNQWKYLRCLKCGLVSLYPRPATEIIFKSYDDYLPLDPQEIDRWKIMMKPVIKKSAELIESSSRTGKGRALDIGCGYGFFFHEMKNRGWDAEGIEI